MNKIVVISGPTASGKTSYSIKLAKENNGIIINAGDEKKLYDALSYLIENPNERKQLADKAHETVVKSFSHEVWERNWLNLIQNFN